MAMKKKIEVMPGVTRAHVLELLDMSIAHSLTVLQSLEGVRASIINNEHPDFSEIAVTGLRAEMVKRTIDSIVMFFGQGEVPVDVRIPEDDPEIQIEAVEDGTIDEDAE